jgi:hypothetical protein
MKLAVVVPIVFVFAPTIAAQQPTPSCTAAEYRQFDFWLGDWAVTDSAGTKEYGTNLVTQEEGTCLVHEHWTGSSGGTGQSFNFYEPLAGRWSQVWVASTGSVLRLSGRFDGHSMTLEGESGLPNGRGTLNRIVWTPQADGRVRQLWSVSQDKGATWQPSFDGWYRRKT